MMKRTLRYVAGVAVSVLLLAIALALAACGGDSGSADTPVPQDEEGALADGDERVIHLHTHELTFEPATIRMAVGETVRLTLDNHSALFHDYTVEEPEFVVISETGAAHEEHESDMPDDDMDEPVQTSRKGLHVAAEGGQHADLVFRATEPGEYEFYCSVPGHREAGLTGTIIVE